MRQFIYFFISLVLLECFAFCEEPTDPSNYQNKKSLDVDTSVSSNPGTVNMLTGTGALGQYLFKLKKTSPIRIGAVLLSDGDFTLSKNVLAKRLSGNNVLTVGLNFDTEKCSSWKGGMFCVNFLQFNGMDSNGRVGSIQGFDGMSVLPPFTRSQLYQIWFRQEFFDKKFVIRIGKTIPTLDFNNILKPVPVQDVSRQIPSVSSLLYTPIFINTVNIGVLPGYYNSAYGITSNIALTSNYYISAGAFDGNLAKGRQTGLEGPHFNGYYLYIAETGVSWSAGAEKKPGIIAIGGWYQTGLLSIPNVVKQQGAQGIYLFGSQRLWFRNPGIDNSGISCFWQLGLNNSKILPMTRFLGLGFTAFSLTRPSDSFGMGLAWSKLNKNLFARNSEFMLQIYYQAHLFANTFLEPIFTYIPNPGSEANLPQTCIFSMQLINLF